jgi:hypothetical protein
MKSVDVRGGGRQPPLLLLLVGGVMIFLSGAAQGFVSIGSSASSKGTFTRRESGGALWQQQQPR